MTNFFKNKLSSKKYNNIISNYRETITNEFLIRNTGLFIGDKAFYKIVKIFEILKSIKKVNGEIIEFGVWNGNNLVTIKKLIDYLEMKKEVIGYDNFKGMKKADEGNLFKGNLNLLTYIIKFFKLSKVRLIRDDILNLKKNLKKIPKLSLIYIDCDMYDTTKIILDLLNKKLSKKGLIVFDEAILGNGGEGKAAKLFYKKNKSKFREITLKKYYQPDYILEKK